MALDELCNELSDIRQDIHDLMDNLKIYTYAWWKLDSVMDTLSELIEVLQKVTLKDN